MRWSFKAMVLAALAFVVVELSTAQQPAQTGGFGKGASNPATLIQNEGVKKELRLTDEQLAKVPDAIMKALAEVLARHWRPLIQGSLSIVVCYALFYISTVFALVAVGLTIAAWARATLGKA